jgi:hypothetical protein
MQYVGNNVVYIGQNAFNQSLAAPVGQSAINFTIGGSVRVLDTKAFSNNSVKIKKFIIGGPDDPSLLSTVGEPAIVQNSGSAVESLEIYCSQDRMDYFSKLTATTGRDGANFQLADTSALSIVTV